MNCILAARAGIPVAINQKIRNDGITTFCFTHFVGYGPGKPISIQMKNLFEQQQRHGVECKKTFVINI